MIISQDANFSKPLISNREQKRTAAIRLIFIYIAQIKRARGRRAVSDYRPPRYAYTLAEKSVDTRAHTHVSALRIPRVPGINAKNNARLSGEIKQGSGK
jgi:hypothetical protein